jgi:hypothetical protein
MCEGALGKARGANRILPRASEQRSLTGKPTSSVGFVDAIQQVERPRPARAQDAHIGSAVTAICLRHGGEDADRVRRGR